MCANAGQPMHSQDCPVCRCKAGWDGVEKMLDEKLAGCKIKVSKGTLKQAFKELLVDAANEKAGKTRNEKTTS